MPMTKLLWCILVGVSLWVVGVPSGAAAQSCSASFNDMAFGSVSLRDGTPDRQTRTIHVTCSGGLPSSGLNVCISVGAGSGGSAAGNSPRYMRRWDNTILDYQLVRAFGGAAWQTESFSVQLDGDGRVAADLQIHGEITSQGAGIEGGSYSSVFSTSALGLTFGPLSCTTAGSVTTGFTVSANVVPACTLTTGAMDFGNIAANVIIPVDAQTSVSVSCTTGAAFSISLGPGQGAGVTDPSARRMSNGASTLTYGLYKDSGRTAPWGWAGSDVVSGTGTDSQQSFTVFGRINSGQVGELGTYTDSVVVTVTY